ncbi:MAG: WHG domain-containing protein [Myxococcota bacterium]
MGRRKGPALTRSQVVDAAIEVVRSEGADALGVTRVAKALGIQPPSLYAHVGKGDDLARAVALEGSRQVLEGFKDAVRGVVEPRAQLRALATTHRRWATANAGLYVLMSRVEPRNDDPLQGPVIRETLDLFARPLLQLGVADDDLVHAIRGIRAAVHGFVLLESTGQFQLDAVRDASFQWMVDALLAGVG